MKELARWCYGALYGLYARKLTLRFFIALLT